MPRATIPALEARIEQLERERDEARQQATDLLTRIAELRAVFRIMLSVLTDATEES